LHAAPSPPVPLPPAASAPLQQPAQQHSQPQPKAGISGLLIVVIIIGVVVVLVGGGITALVVVAQTSSTSAGGPSNEGANPVTLAPAAPLTAPAPASTCPDVEIFRHTGDCAFDGSSRCYIRINNERLSCAREACDAALRCLSSSDPPNTEAMLYYNEGLIECGGRPCPTPPRNAEGARRFFQRSLNLRENSEVRAALESLP